jgi:hypothetical protein
MLILRTWALGFIFRAFLVLIVVHVARRKKGVEILG